MNAVAITLDIDWAPDYMIDYAAARLLAGNVRATWFVTHHSAAIDRLSGYPELFELGIHPNFLPGTTHGKTETEVLAHCLRIVPNATSVRMHGLVQSSNLLGLIARDTQIETDVSLFLPHADNLEPVQYFWPEGAKMIRIPYFWEDDFEMARPEPIWSPKHLTGSTNGVKIFDFHPVHIFLNADSLEPYRSLRNLGALENIPISRATEFAMPRNLGTCAMFDALINHLSATRSWKISEISNTFLAS